MTQFRVLPVRQGDAYLLKSRRGSYLVDGGALSGFLPEMLRERLTGKLRAVVCTVACPERLGGIIDLMDSGYPVGEYWLPESFRAVVLAATRFNGDWSTWFTLCRRSASNVLPSIQIKNLSDPREGKLVGCAMLAVLACASCFGVLPKQAAYPLAPSEVLGSVLELLVDRTAGRWSGTLSSLFRDVSHRFISGGGQEDLALLCGQLLFREGDSLKVKSHNDCRTLVRGLSMALMVEALRLRDGVKMRFFQRTDRWEGGLVSRHPIKCLNGVEASDSYRKNDVPIGARAMFEAAFALFGSDEGLVFQYGDIQCGVLFCGNSRMSFLGRKRSILLRRPTVITAPQRGNVGVDEAYSRIASNNPVADVWVRAHYSYARKVSDVFKKQPVRYCLYNCESRAVQEVLLSFSGGRWNSLAGGVCNCETGALQKWNSIVSNKTFA